MKLLKTFGIKTHKTKGSVPDMLIHQFTPSVPIFIREDEQLIMFVNDQEYLITLKGDEETQ